MAQIVKIKDKLEKKKYETGLKDIRDSIVKIKNENNCTIKEEIYLHNTIGNVKENNEDTFYFNIDKNFTSVFVFDGHGGKDVSEYLQYNFEKIFIDNLIKDFKWPGIEQKITDLFVNLDKKIKNNKELNSFEVGSTVSGFILTDNKIIFINLGDSKTLFYNNVSYFFTIDHTPSNEDEKSRILQTSKIQNKRINNIINVSRALGDFRFKKNKNKLINPISNFPDIKIIDITNETSFFIIVATDGLTIMNEKIIYLVSTRLKEMNKINEIPTSTENNFTNSTIDNKNIKLKIVSDLINESNKYDNITVILYLYTKVCKH